MKKNAIKNIFDVNKNGLDVGRAVILQYLSIPAEIIIVIIVYNLFIGQLTIWAVIALCLLVGRGLLLLITNKTNQAYMLVLSNALSCMVWLLFGVMCSSMSQMDIHISALILAGVVSGALLFLTNLRYLFTVYSSLTLGVFSILIMFKGGSFVLVGSGLIVLVIFLSILSLQYHNLLNTYYVLSNANSLLYNEEKKQVDSLTSLQNELNANIYHRKSMENKIIQSNKLIQTYIQSSIVDDQLMQLEIEIIYTYSDYGILLSDDESSHFISNDMFKSIWNLSENISLDEKVARTLINETVTKDNHLFLSLFPFTSNKISGHRRFEITLNDGRLIECQLKLLYKGEGLQNLWIFRDVTNKHINNASIMRLAQYDSLTELPSRRMIYEKLNFLVEDYKRKDLLFAVAFMDINDFKLVNDSMGHAVGNEIIKTVGERLKSSIRDIDFSGRLGGDEFICIFTELTYKSDIEPLVGRLQSALNQPITINSNSLMINACIGISYYPCDSTYIEELISFADIAMYRAKEHRNKAYECFLPHFTKQINELHEVGQQLKSALINNAFYLMFQPIYDTSTKEIAKVEVLLRWRDNVLPGVFIPLAERMGLINDIGLWVLGETCKVRAALAQSISDNIKFCINISQRQIQTSHHIQQLINLVKNSSCNPKWLEFEIKESCLVDLKKAISFIGQLKELGISVAIDDFGTGFSSLSYLKSLYFDDIKIDKQFIAAIFDKPREMQIFLAIIHLSKMLDVNITIEGIETEEQYNLCVSNGCHYVQGYYLDRPVLFDKLTEKLIITVDLL